MNIIDDADEMYKQIQKLREVEEPTNKRGPIKTHPCPKCFGLGMIHNPRKVNGVEGCQNCGGAGVVG